jgi:hypothetical protein
MMYGFGDVDTPLPETVALVEVRYAAAAQRASHCARRSRKSCVQEMVCDYVSGLVTSATERANLRHGKTTVDDVVAVVSKDPARSQRARELLNANEELRRAQKMIETDEKRLEKMG